MPMQKQLFETMSKLPGIHGLKDLKSRFISASPLSIELLGFRSEDDIYGMTDYDTKCGTNESAPIFIAQDQKVIRTRKSLKILDIHTYSDGDEHILLTEKTPFYTNDNELLGVFATCIDIDRKFLQSFYSKISDALAPVTKKKKEVPSNSIVIVNDLPELNLSQREMNCFFYMTRGYSSSQIADRLNLSVRTIEAYYTSIKNKLGCESKKDIIEFANSSGYTHFIPQELLNETQ